MIVEFPITILLIEKFVRGNREEAAKQQHTPSSITSRAQRSKASASHGQHAQAPHGQHARAPHGWHARAPHGQRVRSLNTRNRPQTLRKAH